MREFSGNRQVSRDGRGNSGSRIVAGYLASPLFVQKVRQERPTQRLEVWFQDGARIGQQGTLTSVWAPIGSRPTAVRQTEYEWCYLFAAVNPLTGSSSAMVTPTVHTMLMDQHLAFISREVGPQVHGALVLDRAGWHLAKALKVPENITLLHLPPYSPELNPVEIVWNFLRGQYLSDRICRDYDELVDETTTAWNRLDSARLQSLKANQWVRLAI